MSFMGLDKQAIVHESRLHNLKDEGEMVADQNTKNQMKGINTMSSSKRSRIREEETATTGRYAKLTDSGSKTASAKEKGGKGSKGDTCSEKAKCESECLSKEFIDGLNSYIDTMSEFSSTAHRLANITYDSKRWFSEYKEIIAKNPNLDSQDKAKLLASLEDIKTRLGNYEHEFIKEAQGIGDSTSSILKLMRGLKTRKPAKSKDASTTTRDGSKKA